ncbi:MAG: 16S rRNA (cytidine(1402)-2'-O)-methyltransferase [Tissierellia bacterium]|nr:16S rRNA (cytidine(1402)-2'-O)-methyltransferase [Tissierellia bacterium]
MLYLCPTPIGNLEDITYRTIRVLQEVDVIAAEDTRHSGSLLKHYGITTPMLSFHEHNEAKRSVEIANRIKNGEKIAVISDAGMPGISDPGSRLIRLMIEEELPYTVLPGSNAAVVAVVASGFPVEGYCYLGFLPTKSKARDNLLNKVYEHPGPLVIYEAPHRLKNTLLGLAEVLGDRNVVLARELTKLHETYHRGSLMELAENHDPRGEYVVVVEGYIPEALDDHQLKEALNEAMGKGMSKSDAISWVCRKYDVKKNRVYSLALMEDIDG